MAIKQAKDLKRGDVIVIVNRYNTPSYRALIAYSHEGAHRHGTDKWHIGFFKIDIAGTEGDVGGDFWIEPDVEFDTTHLLTIEEGDAAYRIGEHAFGAGWDASHKWGERSAEEPGPAKIRAWLDYYPPNELTGIL